MASHRVQIPIPEKYESLVDVEQVSHRLSSTLMPEMEATWGPIWGANNEVIVYSAHGWQPDGSFVYLSVSPGNRTIDLYVDTKGLARPLPPPGGVEKPVVHRPKRVMHEMNNAGRLFDFRHVLFG